MKTVHKVILGYSNIRKDLLIIVIVSIVFIFLYDFWFLSIPEIFSGANAIGEIVYRLCFAYIGAYIFYFLNIFIKTQRDLNKVNYFIARFVLNIFAENYTIITELDRDKISHDLYPTQEEYNAITRSLQIKDGPKRSNWFEYFNYKKQKTEKNIDRLLLRSNYLDSELITILSKLEDSEFFIDIDYKSLWENADDNLSFISEHLFNYFETQQELRNYYYDKLFRYIKYSVKSDKLIKVKGRKA